jgi:hypothetical protein
MNAADLLTAAADLVSGDRAQQHGDMRLNHQNIATMWNAYLSIRREPAAPLTAVDVAHMESLLKLARTQSGEDNDDDLVDGAAYLGVASQVGDDQ